MRLSILPILAAAMAAAAPAAPVFAQTATPINSIFNCAASGNRQETGALIGAVAGALLGTQVARNEQTLAGVIGAGLGAAAGSWIGCRMQTTAQTRAQTAIQTALSTGRAQTWTDPQTGASGRVDLYPAYDAPGSAAQVRPVAWRDLRYADGVNTAGSEYASAPGVYSVSAVTNLRANPGTRANIVGRLTAGETFNVVGNVNSGDWLLVERNGVIVGYVADQSARPAAQPSRPAPPVLSTSCQEVSHSMTTQQYGQQTERYRACRDTAATGGWSLTRL